MEGQALDLLHGASLVGDQVITAGGYEHVPDSDVTAEYCARHNWIVGSPVTVAEKIARIHDEVGGFGHLLVFGFDYVEHAEAWRRSLELLAKEVLPRVKHLSA